MRRLRLDGAKVRQGAIRSIEWLNPVVGSPSAALETAAYLDSFGTSLMPRTSSMPRLDAASISIRSSRRPSLMA